MRNLFYYLLIVLFLAPGCNSFLDVKSNKNLVVAQSLEDALALLDDYQRMNELRVPSWGESVSDDYYLTDHKYSLSSSTIQKFYTWDYQEYFGTNNNWSNGYIPIYNANLSLDILSKIDRNSDNAYMFDLTKGSALFYRSYYLFSLLVVFAEAYDENTAHEDLGVVLRLTSDFNVKSFRSTVKECFEQIEKDLKESTTLLPELPTFLGRPSKAAAFAALARLYLYKRDYNQALKYADLALEIKNDLIDFNGDEDILKTTSPSAPTFAKFNKETIFYAEGSNSLVYFPNGSTAGAVDSVLYNSYSEFDLRKDLFFSVTNELPYFKGQYTNSTKMFGGISVNELFLIKSECLALLDELENASQVLKMLLLKRYSNFENVKLEKFSKLDLIEYIRMERRKELPFRGLRFLDIKRLNKEGANIILKRIVGNKEYILEPNSKKYALPLPSDIIAITGIQQN